MSASYDWDYDAMLPAGLYDVAANETWLEEKAQEGYRISKIEGRRFYFVKGEEVNSRFRLQPMWKKKEKLDEECIELYRELGWEYVGAVSGVFHLWRCANETAPELDTDPVVQADGYRYLKGCMRRSAVIEAVVLLGVLALCVLLAAGGSTGLRNILRDSVPLQTLALLTAMGCAIPWEVMEISTMRRLLMALEAGIPLERPRSYRKKQWIQRVMLLAYICYAILQCVSFFWPVGNGDILGWSAKDRDGSPKSGIVYVDVEHLAEQGYEMDFRTVRTKFHELAPRITQVDMGSWDGDVSQTAETTHYHLLGKFLVTTLVSDIQYAYRNWGPFEEMEAEGLDRFLVSHRKETQVVIAAKENEVLEVFYSGETDLSTQGDYFASLLT